MGNRVNASYVSMFYATKVLLVISVFAGGEVSEVFNGDNITLSWNFSGGYL